MPLLSQSTSTSTKFFSFKTYKPTLVFKNLQLQHIYKILSKSTTHLQKPFKFTTQPKTFFSKFAAHSHKTLFIYLFIHMYLVIGHTLTSMYYHVFISVLYDILQCYFAILHLQLYLLKSGQCATKL